MKTATQIFKALSDETRLRILGLLLEGELCVCELVAVLGLPQSTVSRHLANLRNARLVIDSRHGIWMHYRLPDGDGSLQEHLLALLRTDLTAFSQVRDDQKKLRKYVQGKRAVVC